MKLENLLSRAACASIRVGGFVGGIVLCATISGCETTGDPNSGGIFWSERKAQQRLYEREGELNSLNRETRSVDYQNRQLQNRESELIGY